MHSPPQDIQTALYRAALANGVPISLLGGLCFALTQYDPRAQGTLPKADQAHAAGKGLFLLSAAACDVLGVPDPFDPVANARAAGVLLARLGRDYKWDPQAMVTAFIFGRNATQKAVAAQRPVPAEVRDLLDRTLTAQVWLQERAEPNGHSTRAWPPDRSQGAELDNAIEGLAAANPGFTAAQALGERWRKYRDAPRGTGAPVFDGPAIVKFWQMYDATFARAPITDSRTPLPSRIKPEAYTPTLEAAKRALHASGALPLLDQAWAGVGLALLLWGVAALGGRRRSASA